MKLTTLINNFHENYLAKERFHEIQDYHILHQNLSKIFPSQAAAEMLLKFLDPKSAEETNYNAINLPLHTRDSNWLINYIDYVVNHKEPHCNHKVKYNHIHSYVLTNAKFDQTRCRYEENIVRAEIKSMATQRIHAYSDKLTKKHEDRLITNADEAFRREVVNKTREYGINQHSIEASLEKNAGLWREQAMDIEFINKYLGPIAENRHKVPFNQYVEIVNQVISHRNDWLALREFEYYQYHKDILDELNLATENMKMKPNDAITKNTAWHKNYQSITQVMDHKANNFEPGIDLTK